MMLHVNKNTPLIQCNTPGPYHFGIIDSIDTFVSHSYTSYRSEMMLLTSFVTERRNNAVIMKVYIIL